MSNTSNGPTHKGSKYMMQVLASPYLRGLVSSSSTAARSRCIITHYSLWAMQGDEWVKLKEGEFSNIVNNPIWQTITIPEVKTKLIRLDAERLNQGARVTYDDLEVL